HLFNPKHRCIGFRRTPHSGGDASTPRPRRPGPQHRHRSARLPRPCRIRRQSTRRLPRWSPRLDAADACHRGQPRRRKLLRARPERGWRDTVSRPAPHAVPRQPRARPRRLQRRPRGRRSLSRHPALRRDARLRRRHHPRVQPPQTCGPHIANCGCRLAAMAIHRRTQVQYVLMFLACGLALVISWFGMFAMAWGGSLPSGSWLLIPFWLIPALALPVAIAKWIWPRLPLAIYWVMTGCLFASAAWNNWSECAAGRCVPTAKPLIILGGAVYPPLWGWVLMILLLYIERRVGVGSRSEATP